MGKVFFTVRALYSYSESSCLCVTEVRAGADLEIFLLLRRPCLNIVGLNLQISQIARAAFKRSYRYIHAAEQLYRVAPHFVEPFHAFLGPADNYHFLLFKLVNAVNAAFLYSVSALFLTEAGRVAGQGEG